jgi:hypothetical protein
MVFLRIVFIAIRGIQPLFLLRRFALFMYAIRTQVEFAALFALPNAFPRPDIVSSNVNSFVFASFIMHNHAVNVSLSLSLSRHTLIRTQFECEPLLLLCALAPSLADYAFAVDKLRICVGHCSAMVVLFVEQFVFRFVAKLALDDTPVPPAPSSSTSSTTSSTWSKRRRSWAVAWRVVRCFRSTSSPYVSVLTPNTRQ